MMSEAIMATAAQATTGDAELRQQRMHEEELDRIRTEGDLALVHAQAERQLIAAVDDELRQLQKQLKEKKKQLTKLTGASASGVVGDAVALEQITRRHARAQQELEERLKSALSSKVLELQKLRHEIDETRKRRVGLLQSEASIVEETRALEDTIKQSQSAVEALKEQASALRSDIAKLEEQFDQERQAFRLERQQLQLELDRIARPERVAVKVNVLGRINEISMLRRIGAIEERVMQHVLGKIAKDVEASGQSETLRRLQKYRGSQKQTDTNGSTLLPTPLLPSILAPDDDPATADDEIDGPVIAVHASSCHDSDSMLNELLQHPRVKKAKTTAAAAAGVDSPASSVKSEPMEHAAPSTPQRVQQLKKDDSATLSSPFTTPPRRARSSDGTPQSTTTPMNDGGETSARPRKRRNALREDSMKPLTPSKTVQSSMNASLVFDMVTTLSTNDPGVAIATLRSIVVLGKEYPSNLLYDELVDRILSTDAVAYPDAVSIYASLVFVFDKAATCSCDLAFPYQWDPFANALQDAVVQPKCELWRRNLLVVQFYVYCFEKDWQICRERYLYSLK
ncbi:hypothetical protein P43SY_002649 [Pythium insidiosum]|uniref:Uncharacterized protein n=1 Tax=Pythium insidiosum TaxID=114742 RepID=A0AAD5LUG1_PYTIN|nr:hypothetical protein P43SY_002649 [Pythium insidiosum]